jgi:hypothetical protein
MYVHMYVYMHVCMCENVKKSHEITGDIRNIIMTFNDVYDGTKHDKNRFS